mmetsp:Transcript_10038/g.21326  ORF Transcript_10038/g.21326 Transcript_10038/m.21326 type:complete len:299 (+) Transcript_10038:710-1606(+)
MTALECGGRGGEEVAPDARKVRAGDAAAFVGDLDHHILVRLAVGDDYLHGWHVRVDARVLRHGTQRVLQQLEHDVVQMGRDVREGQVGPAKQHHRRRVTVRPFAEVRRVLHRLSEDLRRRGAQVDQADVPGQLRLAVELEVLADEDADADAAHVELVEEGVDLHHVAELEALAVLADHLHAQLMHAARHRDEGGRVALVDALEQVEELLLALRVHGWPRAADLDEGLLVPLADADDGRHGVQPFGQALQLDHTSGQADRELSSQEGRDLAEHALPSVQLATLRLRKQQPEPRVERGLQ